MKLPTFKNLQLTMQLNHRLFSPLNNTLYTNISYQSSGTPTDDNSVSSASKPTGRTKTTTTAASSSQVRGVSRFTPLVQTEASWEDHHHLLQPEDRGARPHKDIHARYYRFMFESQIHNICFLKATQDPPFQVILHTCHNH